MRHGKSDSVASLTPRGQIGRPPKGIEKVLGMLREWSKGEGKAFSKKASKLRHELKRTGDLWDVVRFADTTSSARLVVFERPSSGELIFAKRTVFRNEFETLHTLKKSGISGELLGYFKPSEFGLVIREFVPGVDCRLLALAEIPDNKLMKLIGSLGGKLRKLHGHNIGLPEDSDLIIDLKGLEVYFVDFERRRLLHRELDKRQDFVDVRWILADAKPKMCPKLWNKFLKSYGGKIAKALIEDMD